MARIVMADGGFAFDGHSLGQGPLGSDETAFVDATIALLADNEFWRRQSTQAVAFQGTRGWPDAAPAFERLISS